MGRLKARSCRDTKDSEFVTLFYGVFNSATRRLTYCSAGHPPAMLLRGGKVTELNSDNLVLGIDPNEQYVQSVIDLKKDDAFLIYTDGLTDGMNFANQVFGRQRIADAFQKGGATSEVMSQNLLWELRKFVGIGKRTDDVTLIVGRVM